MELYFSDQFRIDADLLEDYGAFDVSVVSDLPLFIDPFLLFNSAKPEYQALHEEIIKYLRFLRDEATDDLDASLIKSWYRFPEVRQNWLGYTFLGNAGFGLGQDFAVALHGALNDIFRNFGSEVVTRGSHLEKLCLIRPGIGKDNISDFTTNLIKGYLLRYTERFARTWLEASDCDTFNVPHAVFDYHTKTWAARVYFLPRLGHDYVLLTPADMLTRDDTWISFTDMVRGFHRLPGAVANDELRGQINQYFRTLLGDAPKAKDRREAAQKTIQQFPELIDYYIRQQEDDGNRAESVSSQRVEDAHEVLVEKVRVVVDELERRGEFYDLPNGSYAECLARAKWFKQYIENQDGYKLINRGHGQPFSHEKEVQLFFGLVWYRTDFDVNREPNNGRGPVDFAVSAGSIEKSLIEFKLGSNRSLKRNLEKQIEIYQAANQTRSSVKVIVFYTSQDEDRVTRILRELGIDKEESIVLIDARSDNKPSGSTA